jgi:hypothetical protein
MTSTGSTRVARCLAAVVAGVGTYCLAYHVVFFSLWRFLFGEEVWPWPEWSLYLLVILPAMVAVTAVVFFLVAGINRMNLLIAAVVCGLSLLGLFGYAGEVWKVMIKLGFHP